MDKLKKVLQQKIDLLKKEIEDSGFVLKNGKVKEIQKVYYMRLNSSFYSHFDGHSSDAICYDDNVEFQIKGALLEAVKNDKIESISFTKDDEENIIYYEGEEIGSLHLDYQDCSIFSEWFLSLTEFKMIKKGGVFMFDGTLKVDDEQSEHTWAELYIEKRTVNV